MRIAVGFSRLALSVLILIACVVTPMVSARAQFQDFLGQGKGFFGEAGRGDPEVTVSLTPAEAQPGDEVTLSVTVKLPPDSYTYSMNPGFGGATKIDITKAVGLTPLETGFEADHRPEVIFDKYLGRLEKYHDQVTWSRKYRIQPEARIDQVSVAGLLDYQVCDKSTCTPLKKPVPGDTGGRPNSST